MTNIIRKTKLSEHFSKEEMTYSRIAVENGLDNEPLPAVLRALGYLATHLLEPLRQLHNGPIAILSGYRSDAVNRLAGGVATSQHRKGEAADCYIAEGPECLLEILRESGLPFDQAILYRRRRFLHISLKEDGQNRMQVLFYTMLCLLLLLPSCRTRRESAKEVQTSRTDSLVVAGKDSSFFNHTTFTADSINWKITRVALLPPDSTGRQYPAEITLLEGNKLHNVTDTIKETSHSSLILTGGQTDLSLSSSEKKQSQSFPVWLWFAAGVFIFYILFRLLYSSTRFSKISP